MVGGYVMVPIADVMFNPAFESGTKVPGSYKIVEAAHATGKMPVCCPMNRALGYSPFATLLFKNGGAISFSVGTKLYTVKPDDTVIVD